MTGQDYTVSVSVAPVAPGAGVPTGTVTVTDSDANTCVVTLDGLGVGSCVLPSRSAGPKTLDAHYNGDADYNQSDATQATHAVDQATTTTELNVGPNPSVFGESAVFTATVTVGGGSSATPAGDVEFFDGLTSLGSLTLDGSGEAQLATNALAVGDHDITAVFSDAGDFAGSTSDVVVQTVQQAPTSTDLSSSPNPSVFGESVTFTATVTAGGGSTVTPAGDVEFFDGLTSLGSVTLDGFGVAELSTADLSVGDHDITAVFSDSDEFADSTSDIVVQTVAHAATTTTIDSDTPAPTVVGQSYVVTVTVAPVAPGAGTPAGSVNVSDGTDSCVVTLSSGAGSCDLTSTSAGAKTLQATYEGDSSFSASTTTAGHQVDPAATTTTIDSDDPDPSVVGQPYAVAVTVAPVAPGAGTPLGVVHVTDGSASCNVLLSSGTGSCNLPSVTAGDHGLTATYLGSTDFATSPGTASHHVDAAGTTTLIVGDSPDPTVPGQSYTISWLVTVPAPGSGTPTGTVTVDDGLGGTCTAAVEAGHCSLATAAASNPTVTATYSGDADFGSSSDVEAHSVSPGSTTTTVTGDTPDPTVVGVPYAVSWSVAVDAPASGTPTGTVLVSDGTDTCSANVADGSCLLTSTTGGLKLLTATYSGDLDFTGSVGSGAHQVNPASTTASITGDTPDPSVVGQAVPVHYSVTVDAPGTGTPSGFVAVFDDDSSAACISTVAAGQCSVTFDAVGTHHLHAQYLGNSSFSASAPSAAETHDVAQASTITVITTDAPDPSVLGQSVTVGFMVAVAAPGSGTPTGNVVVTDEDSAATCTATLAAGSCSLTLANLGAHHLRATYQGDASFNASSPSPVEAHTVVKASTTTSIAGDTPDPSVTGQSVTVQYSVAVEAPGTGTPTGNVVVTDADSAATCTATVADGQCSLSLPATGTHHLTATYQGDADFLGSVGAVENHTVNKDTTTASVTSDTPDPSVTGQSVTVGFAVTADAPGAGTPTGTVLVTDDDSSAVCVGTVAAGSCSITISTGGAHHLRAMYLGDANFLPSAASEPVDHTVVPASTITAVLSDTPDPSAPGQSVTVSYLVAVSAPGLGTPTGNVEVTDADSAATCTATVLAGQCSLTLTAPGAHHLTVTYLGNADFNGSASVAADHQVGPGSTTAAITSDSPDSSVVGESVTVGYSVSAVAPATGTPTGNVVITDADSAATCTGTVAAGQCSLTLTTTGTHHLRATYQGDANFQASAPSAAENHTVNAASTTTSVASALPDPSVTGQAVTVTFSVAPVAPGAGTPTGNVVVTDDDSAAVCFGTVAAGSCQLTIPSASTHHLHATYLGDGSFLASGASTALVHTVDRGFDDDGGPRGHARSVDGRPERDRQLLRDGRGAWWRRSHGQRAGDRRRQRSDVHGDGRNRLVLAQPGGGGYAPPACHLPGRRELHGQRAERSRDAHGQRGRPADGELDRDGRRQPDQRGHAALDGHVLDAGHRRRQRRLPARQRRSRRCAGDHVGHAERAGERLHGDGEHGHRQRHARAQPERQRLDHRRVERSARRRRCGQRQRGRSGIHDRPQRAVGHGQPVGRSGRSDEHEPGELHRDLQRVGGGLRLGRRHDRRYGHDRRSDDLGGPGRRPTPSRFRCRRTGRSRPRWLPAWLTTPWATRARHPARPTTR